MIFSSPRTYLSCGLLLTYDKKLPIEILGKRFQSVTISLETNFYTIVYVSVT